jgi:hypothetical protein
VASFQQTSLRMADGALNTVANSFKIFFSNVAKQKFFLVLSLTLLKQYFATNIFLTFLA